jgi:RNA polymerase sigma-70 factor (ECF subfamily)
VEALLDGDDGRRTTEARLTLARVQQEIARLPEEQRVVLTLICVEDMSYRDAAEILDVPMGTVMSRLARARRTLAQTVGEDAALGARA